MHVIEGNLEVPLREPHDSPDATPTRAIGDENLLTRLEAADTRVMRSLLSKSNRRPWRERLVAAKESG